MTLFEILDALEARSLVLWYDRRHRHLISHDWFAFPKFLTDAITGARAELARLIDRHGVRLGYHKIGAWHVVVTRTGVLETSCRVTLASQRLQSLATDLPPIDPERRELLCQRCAQQHVARELARIPRLIPGAEDRRV